MDDLTFDRDLARGKEIEHEILSLIQKKYPKAYIQPGQFKPYDIYIPEIDTSVEVKNDEKSHYTGNFLIEIEMPPGTPSGLQTTEADWWVICDKEVYCWITPDALWDIINTSGARPATFVGKGDTTEKKAYLIKKGKIIHSPYTNVQSKSKKSE